MTAPVTPAASAAASIQRRFRLRVAGLLVVLACGFVLLGVLAADVLRKIDQQATASSDNVQFTLSQLEIEYLHFENALALALVSEAPDLRELRRRFDVFYSRVVTIGQGEVYRALREQPWFDEHLSLVRGTLDREIPLIDSDDATLAASLTRLNADIPFLHDTIRDISIEGIEVFARLSDEQREAVRTTLIRVAVVTLLLILSLIVISVWLARLWRSARLHEEEASRASARAEAMLNSSLDAIIAVDGSGRIIDFNGAAEEVFGQSAAAVIGGDMATLIVPPHLRDSHNAGMARHLRTGEKRIIGRGRQRFEAMRADGTIFPAEISVAETRSGDEKLFVAYVRDITARVAAEAELLRARDEALAGERAKANLLAVMSHEMRTPLNGLIGTLDLLADTALDRRQRDLLRVMQTSGRILLTHVNNVLDISRIDSGKATVQSEVVDLPALVGDVAESQRAVAEENGNTISVEYDMALPRWVLTDAVRLQQVLLNLIGNAVKFTHDGDILIEVSPDPAQDWLVIRVADTGIGMAPDDLDRIFEDFAMVDSSYSRKAEGTGLGLGIVRRVVALMGGEIGAESEKGEGSLFWVRLPMPATAAPAEAESAPPPVRVAAAPAGQEVGTAETLAEAPPPEPAVAGHDVLVIEDNEINRIVVGGMLERFGHRVTLATDGVEGVETAATRRFDLILTDISMPRMDGVEAARHIRDGGGPNAQTPIMALTAHALPDEIARFHAAGMQRILTKPLTRAALQEALADLDAPAAPAQAAAPAAPPVIDESIRGALVEDLGPDQADRLTRGFLESTGRDIDHLVTTAEAMTDADVIGLVHKIAGGASLFGAARLGATLRALETAGKAGDIPTLRSGVAGLRPLWDETAAALAVPAKAA